MDRIRLGIVATELMKWGGGIDFLIDFIKIFELHPEKYLCYVILPNKNSFEYIVRKLLKKEKYYDHLERIKECLKVECPNTPILYYTDRFWKVNGRYNDIKQLAYQEHFNFLMPMPMIMRGVDDKNYITVSYIYDFQHKHLPEYFSEKERIKRDKYFKRLLFCYDFAFTQSQDTLKDIESYYKEYKDKVYVMYAYPHKISNNVFNESIDEIIERYRIHKYYFIICNQFWIHKNHRIVFEALEKLYLNGIKDVDVICTGDTCDSRHPEYFSDILKYIDSLKCKDNIKILGYISKTDQITLLKHSVSLIQPTLFEGNPGGGAVVDAEAYGVSCIVSNIPVNLEIPKCFEYEYFNPHDAEELAGKMQNAYERFMSGKLYECSVNYEDFYKEYDSVITDMLDRKRKQI